MAEHADGGLIQYGFSAHVNAGELAEGDDVVQSFFCGKIGQAVPMLKAMNVQHVLGLLLILTLKPCRIATSTNARSGKEQKEMEGELAMNNKMLFIFCYLLVGVALAHDIQDEKDFEPSQFDSEIEKHATRPCLYNGYETLYQLFKHRTGKLPIECKQYVSAPETRHHIAHWYASLRPQLEGLNKTECLMVYGTERMECSVRYTVSLESLLPPAGQQPQ